MPLCLMLLFEFIRCILCHFFHSKLFHVRSVTQGDVIRADAKDIPKIFQVSTSLCFFMKIMFCEGERLTVSDHWNNRIGFFIWKRVSVSLVTNKRSC